MAATISTIETIFNDLLAEAAKITTTNNYRNNVVKVSESLMELDQITDFPVVVVVINDGQVDAINDAKTSFLEPTEFGLIGYVEGSLQGKGSTTNTLVRNAESLIHDFKVMLAGLTTTHLDDSSRRYSIVGRERMIMVKRLLAFNANKGIVGVFFKVRPFAQNSTFSN